MRVHEVMHHAIYVPSTLSVAEAVRLMERENTDSVLVRHGSGVGILTEHDVLRKVVARDLDPAHVSAAAIMSTSLYTIDSQGEIEEASDLMAKHNIRRLVVMENGAIIGIISAACIARNVKYITANRLLTAGLGSSVEFAG